MNFSKIYYINLDEDTKKQQFFLDQMSKTCLHNKCERFAAIDGKNLDINTISNTIISNRARDSIISQKQKVYGISLTYGSLGCALSHKKIWEECSVSDGPFLIFEDDAIPCNDFNIIFINVMNELIKINYDIFYIGYNEIRGFVKNTINNILSKPSGLITGMYGYMITPEGANKLLSIFPLDKQIDSSISHNLKNIEAYCSTTKLISANIKFGSKTQQARSCINNIQGNIDDNWNELFQ